MEGLLLSQLSPSPSPSLSPSPSPSIPPVFACRRRNPWCAVVSSSAKPRREPSSSCSSSSSSSARKPALTSFGIPFPSSWGGGALLLSLVFALCNALAVERRRGRLCFFSPSGICTAAAAAAEEAAPKGVQPCVSGDSRLHVEGIVGEYYRSCSWRASPSCSGSQGPNSSICEDSTLDGHGTGANHCGRPQKACSSSDSRGFVLSISGVSACDGQEIIGGHYYKRSEKSCPPNDFRGSNLSIYEDSILNGCKMGANYYERFRKACSLSDFRGFYLSILGVSAFDGQEIGARYYERSEKSSSLNEFPGSNSSVSKDSALEGHEIGVNDYERFRKAFSSSDFRGFDMPILGVSAFEGQEIGAHYYKRSKKSCSPNAFRGSNSSIYEDSTLSGHGTGANHYERSRNGYSLSDFRGFDSLISGVSACDGEEIGAHYHEISDKPSSSNNFEGGPQMRRNKINSFVKDAAAQVGPSVVRLDTQRVAATTNNSGNHYLLSPWFKGDDSDKSPREKGVGSGFVVDSKQGLIVTNAHVVKGADHVKVTFSNGKAYEGTVIGLDDITDLAVLKVTKSIQGIQEAPLGDSEMVELGDCVIAFGNPLGLDNTISLGIISSLSRTAFEVGIVGKQLTLFQTDCAINPGNSGGPLANEFGEVIGINTAIRADAEGIAFAIPINIVKRVVEALSKGLVIKHPFLGIQMENFSSHNNSNRKDVWGLDCEGVLVLKVYEGSSASRAGLRSGDVIVEVDGEKIFGTLQLYRQIWRFSIGQEFKLCVYRGEERIEISVKLCESSDSKESGGL